MILRCPAKHLAFSLCIGSLLAAGCLNPSAPGNLVPGTVDDDPSLPRAELNGTVFHLETYGNPINPPVIVLHGGPGHDYRCMLSLVQDYGQGSLADDFFFVFWDQRGAGLSRRHSDGALFSLDNYLKDLEAVVNAYAGARKVVLIGHSWGGGYASMYINNHPENIAGAVLLEPMPLSTELNTQIVKYSDPFLNEWSMDWVWMRQLIGMNDHAQADYAISTTVTGDIMEYRGDDKHPYWREGAAVHMFIDPQLWGEGVRYDFTRNLDRVNVPVLFIAGEKTKDLGVAFQRIQSSVFPNASVETVSDAGHYDIVWNRADTTSSIIRKYFQSLKLDP